MAVSIGCFGALDAEVWRLHRDCGHIRFTLGSLISLFSTCAKTQVSFRNETSPRAGTDAPLGACQEFRLHEQRIISGGNTMSNIDFLSLPNEFVLLSLRDLLAARELFHLHLMHKPNVVATAVGRYRIRKSDPWPEQERPSSAVPLRHHAAPRTLSNSEVRTYSWPAILVFVKMWIAPGDFDPPRGCRSVGRLYAERTEGAALRRPGRKGRRAARIRR